MQNNSSKIYRIMTCGCQQVSQKCEIHFEEVPDRFYFATIVQLPYWLSASIHALLDDVNILEILLVKHIVLPPQHAMFQHMKNDRLTNIT